MLHRLPNRLNKKTSETHSHVLFLDSFPKVSAYLVILSLVFGVFKLHIFYTTFFRIPIFQYLELSEIVLFSPSILGLLVFYMIIYSLIFFLPNSKINSTSYYIATTLISALLMLYLYRNSLALSDKVYFILFFVTCLPLMLLGLLPKFLISPTSKYTLLIPFMLMIYFSLSESIIFYGSVHYSKYYIPVKLKLKTGNTIESSKDFKYIGRTSRYWFFYSSKYNFTRAISEEDVAVSEISNFEMANEPGGHDPIPNDPRKPPPIIP